MRYEAKTPEEYIDQIPEERKDVFSKLRAIIKEHLPDGFEETMSYGMIAYVVPHSIYPKGYHVNPHEPLPFINIASQKNFISLYHSGVYADSRLYEWFAGEYIRRCKTKPDMGKSCIRFKNIHALPYSLIAELAGKMTLEEWIRLYENKLKKK